MILNLFGLIKKIMAEKAQVCAYGLMSTIVLMGYQSTANASSIIVQNGRGLVGVANETFSTSFTGVTTNASAGDTNGVLFGPFEYITLIFYPKGNNCIYGNSLLMDIDGVRGLKFNTAGTLMLVPEINYIDTRTWTINGVSHTDTVTAIFNGYGSNTNENFGENSSCIWTPKQSTPNNGIDTNTLVTHNVTATGRVLIYGTGQQQSSEGYLTYSLELMLRNPRWSFAYAQYGLLFSGGSRPVIVSDLGCTLTTPMAIDFGAQSANATNGELLATKSDGSLTVNCQQSTNPMSATLSLSAGINPIYFSGDDYQVNLINSENNAGAYVTMSLNVNGTPTNIPFNRTLVDIGTIDASHSSASFSYPITYSLYSRGTGITGKVKGSAELSIVLR
ncbi:hypothetical protein AAHD08_003388 [Providencia rettgeri]